MATSERGGHGVLIEVRLEEFWVYCPAVNFFSFRTVLIGTIVAEIDFTEAQSSEPLLTETINATYHYPFPLNLTTYYRNALNATLEEFVREFSFDSKVLEALGGLGSAGADLHEETL
jgi:hypothetical protein